MLENKTKEELLEKGFVLIGEINGLECVARKLQDDGEFAYFLLNEGVAVWTYPKTSNLETIQLLTSIQKVLFPDGK